jgi:hypothetical protein
VFRAVATVLTVTLAGGPTTAALAGDDSHRGGGTTTPIEHLVVIFQ